MRFDGLREFPELGNRFDVFPVRIFILEQLPHLLDIEMFYLSRSGLFALG